MEISPLLQQWKSLKKRYPDVVLLFRLGDFYETLYEDAVLASKVLGITLTKRQKGVPLAGIPYHSIEPYINKFVKAGYKVAVCEQLEAPKPGKLVKRDVVEVITKGTLIEDALLDSKKNNYLASIVAGDAKYGLALLDLSTGDFKITELSREELIDELKKVNVAEIIAPQDFDDSTQTGRLEPSLQPELTKRDSYEFSYDFAKEELLSHFKIASLEGLGCEKLKLAVGAAGAILSYLKATKKRELHHIKPPIPYTLSQYLILDEPTRKNLELTQKIGGQEGEGTLLWVLDHTSTPMGARLLRNHIAFPLISLHEINSRLEKVEQLMNSPSNLSALKALLAKIADLERLTTRISMERATPRDISALANTLQLFPQINTTIYRGEPVDNDKTQPFQRFLLPLFDSLVSLINKTIVPNPPLNIQPGIICNNVNKELDELRKLSHSGKQWISDFELHEKKRTGIHSLKVGFNNVFGYYIEVTRPNLKLVPQDYIRKQTLTNAERFITEELKTYEARVLSAEERIKRLEYEIFCELRKNIAQSSSQIQDASRKIAELDVLASFALIAKKNKYVRPELVGAGSTPPSGRQGPLTLPVGESPSSRCLIIKDGRHPVVEQLLSEGEFVPNPTSLNDEQQIYIITGPNMAGKSTYLRQVGLIVLMAQMGSFVPASYAKIGICDRIFTRIGASDDLSRGVSTFLAEMNETANILNNASSKSLVLLDEIGRGTSTFDGMSIAWSTVEYLLTRIACKTLFATHYHELTELASINSKIKNYQIAVKRYQDQIIFLRQLRPGGCDESYGIDVAKLAGVPQAVIKRAKELLHSFELKELKSAKERAKSKQTGLFNTPPDAPSPSVGAGSTCDPTREQGVGASPRSHQKESQLLKELKNIDPDKLTPIDALLALKRLKNLS